MEVTIASEEYAPGQDPGRVRHLSMDDLDDVDWKIGGALRTAMMDPQVLGFGFAEGPEVEMGLFARGVRVGLGARVPRLLALYLCPSTILMNSRTQRPRGDAIIRVYC